ncbi:hypothetical protein SAMN05421736_112122 [Evansella caseinilytica]|uniref:Uncharacterized protein n=1 Tax=Evansella caseinilytica TaxID=1503961 RepID=A0A1H3SZ67_9BACI|nr:hypothetical protein SAMN05421736_112122 [Evansella caseinilytica]
MPNAYEETSVTPKEWGLIALSVIIILAIAYFADLIDFNNNGEMISKC